MKETFQQALRTPVILVKPNALRIVLEKNVYEIDLVSEVITVFVQDTMTSHRAAASHEKPRAARDRRKGARL